MSLKTRIERLEGQQPSGDDVRIVKRFDGSTLPEGQEQEYKELGYLGRVTGPITVIRIHKRWDE